MSKYNCDICDIHTNKKTDYSKHIKTKSHNRKVKESQNKNPTAPDGTSLHSKKQHNIYICQYFKNTFTRQSSLSRHIKSCAQIIIDDVVKGKDYEIKDIKLKTLEDTVKTMKNQLETYEKMLTSLSTPQAINNFTYINNTYQNALRERSEQVL